MSRILRRPMFRGGGPVNSYGTGIAAPLVPGYRGGGQIGGGIIYGRPDLDGRYGFSTPKLFNAAEITMPTSNISPGLEYLEKLKNMKQGNVPMIPVNTGSTDEVPAGVDTESAETISIKKNAEDAQSVQDLDFSEMSSDLAPPTTNYEKIEKYIADQDGDGISDLNPEWVKNRTWYNEIFGGPYKKVDEGVKDKRGRNLEEDAQINQQWYADNKAAIDDLDTGAGDGPEEPIVDAKTMMEENAELFKEMLGIKKARGQDISDMLLRFSGSKGNTLGEKFQNYTALESAAGPGRSEQIGKTAAGLSIQDYVAGKRAKEAVDLMKTKVDYEYGKKAAIVDVQKDDNATEALLKIGKKGDVKPNSDAAIKYLVGIADDRSDVFSVNKKGLMKQIGENPAKALKKLKNGVNIVRDGGQIAIVITQKVGDEFKITDIFDSVSEYWNANK